MPCDSVRTTPPVIFSKVRITAHIEVLQSALQSLGYTVERNESRLTFWRTTEPRQYGSGEYRAGTLSLPERWQLNGLYGEDAIRVAYAGAAVKFQAKRYGWTVKETGPNQFEVQRRS